MTLFDGPDISTFLQSRTGAAIDRIARFTDQEILDDAAAAAQTAIDWQTLTDIAVQRGGVSSSEPVERDGAWHIDLAVPYTGGHSALFRTEPSTSSTGPRPVGYMAIEDLHLVVRTPARTAESLNANAQQALTLLERYVGWANEDLAVWRPTLGVQVRTAVDVRSKSIKALRDAAGQLDFPIRPKL